VQPDAETQAFLLESYSDFTSTLCFTFYIPMTSVFFECFGLCFEIDASLHK